MDKGALIKRGIVDLEEGQAHRANVKREEGMRTSERAIDV